MIPAFRQASRSLLHVQRTIPNSRFIIGRISVRTIVNSYLPLHRDPAKRYTKEHELISYDDETSVGRLYITKHAAETLGDVVFVELPKLGREVNQGDQIGAVESVKAASDIYAPISGTVVGINETLDGTPGLMNKEPEAAGWLCDLKVTKPEELKNLLTKKAYEKHCNESA